MTVWPGDISVWLHTVVGSINEGLTVPEAEEAMSALAIFHHTVAQSTFTQAALFQTSSPSAAAAPTATSSAVSSGALVFHCEISLKPQFLASINVEIATGLWAGSRKEFRFPCFAT